VAILETALPGSPVAPINPQTAVPATAQSYVAAIRRLQAAGARHIVVFNLPDAGATPFAQSVPDPRFPPTLTALSRTYNQTLDAGLGALGDGIVPIDAFGLFAQVLEEPGAYGFTNVSGVACTPTGDDASLLACAPAGSGSPVTYAPGANETYLFADGKHPSGASTCPCWGAHWR
jgi:outer membrane lipase/esterase